MEPMLDVDLLLSDSITVSSDSILALVNNQVAIVTEYRDSYEISDENLDRNVAVLTGLIALAGYFIIDSQDYASDKDEATLYQNTVIGSLVVFDILYKHPKIKRMNKFIKDGDVFIDKWDGKPIADMTEFLRDFHRLQRNHRKYLLMEPMK